MSSRGETKGGGRPEDDDDDDGEWVTKRKQKNERTRKQASANWERETAELPSADATTDTDRIFFYLRLSTDDRAAVVNVFNPSSVDEARFLYADIGKSTPPCPRVLPRLFVSTTNASTSCARSHAHTGRMPIQCLMKYDFCATVRQRLVRWCEILFTTPDHPMRSIHTPRNSFFQRLIISRKSSVTTIVHQLIHRRSM